MSRRVWVPVVLAVLIVLAGAGRFRAGQSAQDDRAAMVQTSIDHIFRDHDFDPPRFGPALWLPDGTAYAIVERTGNQSEIAQYDAATGQRTVLASTGLEIDNYEWSADSKRLLIFTNTR